MDGGVTALILFPLQLYLPLHTFLCISEVPQTSKDIKRSKVNDFFFFFYKKERIVKKFKQFS